MIDARDMGYDEITALTYDVRAGRVCYEDIIWPNAKYLEGLKDGLLTNVKTLNPKDTDVIVIEFIEDMTFDQCKRAYEIVSDAFPTHKIIGTRGRIDAKS